MLTEYNRVLNLQCRRGGMINAPPPAEVVFRGTVLVPAALTIHPAWFSFAASSPIYF